MNWGKLKLFLTARMSMTAIYQPVIIKELLLNRGECTKDHLARALAEYDESVVSYYRGIVMRWPKATLLKHGVVRYERNGERFILNCAIADRHLQEAVAICDSKITAWEESRRSRGTTPASLASIRYRVLKSAGGRCLLCGIPASISPIDVDHVIPQSKADRNKMVTVNGTRVHVNSEANLQALCFRCNRAKRDQDSTDFRRTKMLVRDRIPDEIRSHGRTPVISRVKGPALAKALNEKLIEEHAEYIACNGSDSIEELVDMSEVILALAKSKGVSGAKFVKLVEAKRTQRGGFVHGYVYERDE